MKKYLFIDNFRGFTNTYVPLVDVNFLVGENSTGKTSVLSLMRLLSTQRLLFAEEFAEKYVNLGTFRDMVSAHAKDQSYFRIGLIEEVPNEKQAVAMLFTFRDVDGVPRLVRFTSMHSGAQVSLLFAEDRTHFKVEPLMGSTDLEDLKLRVFPQWVRQHRRLPEGFQVLEFPKGIPPQERVPLVVLLSWVTVKAEQRKTIGFMGPSHHEIIWIAPIRTEPRRTYDAHQMDFTPEGSHTPYLIRKILGSKSDAKQFSAFLSKVGKASGLFQSIKIRNFGRGLTDPFELDVVLDGKALKVSTVGYGVSQSLPVLVELIAREPGTWFAIQQPEVHLHPRAQAALGDVFFEMAARESKRFLIETHSDFAIDRFRMNLRKARTKKPISQVLFFERRNKRNTVTPLMISSAGEMPPDQPESYRKFFVNEGLSLLEL